MPEFTTRCYELQTSPDSGFVKTTVCHRFTAHGFVSLRSLICKHYQITGVTEEEVTTLPRYRQVLQETIALAPTLADALWEQVWARHAEWKQTQA